MRRNYTHILPSYEDFNFMPNLDYLFDLSYLTIINVHGDNSKEFLQGQISNDINLLYTDRNILKTAFCDIKGRILALAYIVYQDNFKIIIPKDLKQIVIKTLTQKAVFSKVHLSINTTETLFGFYAVNLLDHECYVLNNNFYLMLSPNVLVKKLVHSYEEKRYFRGSASWHFLQLWQNHDLEIYKETSGEFLPHQLLLHENGYISFTKGCYLGQEIIARMHYRAKLKYTIKYFVIITEQNLTYGTSLFSLKTKNEIGKIVDFAEFAPKKYFIAISILTSFNEKNCYINDNINSIELQIPNF